MGLASVDIVTTSPAWDLDLRPLSISNGVETPVSFQWNGKQLQQLTSAGGATYRFEWGEWLADPRSQGFASGESGSSAKDPANGLPDGWWKGYEPLQDGRSLSLGPSQWAVSRITASDPGGAPGLTTEFTRVLPQPASFNRATRQIAWSSREYSVTVRERAGGVTRFTRYQLAQPLATGECGAPAWPATGQGAQDLSLQRQMLLFALGSVVRQEAGAVENGSDRVHQCITLDGWTLRSSGNPDGSITSTFLDPRATRTTEEKPALEGPTFIQDLTGWDGRRFTREDLAADQPSTQTVALDAGKVRWRGVELGESERASAPVVRTTTGHSQWDATWLTLRPTDRSIQMGGPGYGALRVKSGADFSAATGADLGQSAYGYDTLGRLTSVSGTTGGFTSVLSSSHPGNAPEVSENSWTMNQTADAGEQGEAYRWNGPFRTGVRQKPDPRWTLESRDGAGRLASTTSPDGVVTSFAYDALGRVTRSLRGAVAGAGSLQTDTVYSADGLTITATTQGSDADSVASRTQLDAFGRKVSVLSQPGTAAVQGVFTRYDGFGQKVFESVPLHQGSANGSEAGSTFSHDPDGFLSQITNARGGQTSFTRPVWGALGGLPGFVTRSTTPRGTTSTLTDILGQVRCVQDATGVFTFHDYDAYGRMVRSTRSGQSRLFNYNEVGWLLSQTQPEEGTTTFGSHILGGRPLSRTLGGHTETLSLNTTGENAGLPFRLDASGSGGVSRIYSYSNRRVSSIQESQPYGTLREDYQYNGLGVLVQKTTGDGSYDFTVTRTLDAQGQVRSLRFPGKGGTQTVDFGTDGLGRPGRVALDGVSLASMSYQVGGQDQDRLDCANGARSSWIRDVHQDLSQVIHGTASGSEVCSLAWSADGLLLERGADRFTYDGLSRLVSSDVTGPTGVRTQQGFSYDDWGNRTGLTSRAVAGALPVEAVGYSLAYGADKRIPGGALTGADYDAAGRLRILYTVPGDSSSQVIWSYDALGRVVREYGNQAGGTSFLLEGSGLRFRRSADGGAVEYTVYGFGREALSVFTMAPQPQWKRTMVYGFGQLLAEDLPQGRRWIQSDLVGSPTVMTDASGAVVGRQKALAFGERMPGVGETSTHRYATHEEQGGSAICMQARMYLPAYGRFAQPDPAYDFSADGLNLYGYCSNNPITRNDPSGLAPEKIEQPKWSPSEWEAREVRSMDRWLEEGSFHRDLMDPMGWSQTQTAAGQGGGNVSGSATLALIRLAVANPAERAALLRAYVGVSESSSSVVPNGSLGPDVGGDSGWTNQQALVASGDGFVANTRFIRMTQGAVGNPQDWAHEGTHNADRLAEAGVVLADGNATITNAMSERNAYSMTQMVLRLTNTTATYSGVRLWDSSWSRMPSSQRDAMAGAALNSLLSVITAGLGSRANNLLVQ